MALPGLAFDRAPDGSTRRLDADGRLHVAYNRITKATVNPYLGAEIPGYEALGLKADQTYNLLRDPAELKKAVSTANNIQLLRKHIAVSAADPKHMDVVGSTGTDAKWEAPYITNSLVIWDESAIAGIETEQQCELSCSYRYLSVMEAGEYEGQKYDGRMTAIEFNHVALVEKGRAGPDVLVGDQISKEPVIMPILKKTALSRAVADFTAQAKALEPKLAADAALKPLHATYLKLANDAKMMSDKAKDDEEMDAEDAVCMDPEDAPKAKVMNDKKAKDKRAKDESGEEEDDKEEEDKAEAKDKARDKKARDKKAKDAEGEDPKGAREDDDEKDAKDKAKDRKAMDSAIRSSLRATAEAVNLVRPLVGELDVFAFDSAADVYRFGLKSVGIENTEANTAGLRLAVDMALANKKAGSVPVRFANDSSGPSPFLAAAITKRG